MFECGGDLRDADHLHPIPPASPPERDPVKMAPPVLRGTADVDRIEAPVTAKAYMMCAFASFGGIYFGYDIGWISGVMGMKYAIHTFTGLPYNTPAEDFVIPASDKSLITSILSAGTFFGALAAGDIADFIGRRTTIIIGCLIFMVGVIMEIVATSVSLLSAGRFIAGLGVGFESGHSHPLHFAWALILGGGIACLPESPRYFVKQGQLEKAAKALASVRGQPVDSQFVQQELAEIVANHEYELSVIPQGSYLSSWANCFKGSLWKANSNLRRTILGTSLQMMQQWTGVNFIFFFGTTFFQQLGSISNPFLIGLITTLVNVLSTPISFWTIERFGRRPLLIWGALGMLCCQFLTAILGTAISSDNDAATKAQIAFIFLIGEIFPLPIRSRGVGLSTASNWLWNTIIAVITPYMVDPDKGNLGPKVFFVWGTLCTCACIYAYFLVPETKGLSLEQVDKMLEEVNPRNSAGWKPTTTFANEMGLTKGGVSSEEIVVDVEKRGSVH
ncbi:monosaccharide transporter [Aureobasidium pullulans]|uniref:Monosaccharide transporter n=1 Tax=Aureobasidium pullulans TaxID=5580 RepID=A0A4S8SE44_AURPU|nr:monosaccharide transporter [Aureobasidium pullulans]